MTSGTFEDHFSFRKLSAVEVLGDEFLNFLGIALDGLAESRIIEGTELSDDAVDHRRREYIMLLEHLALLFETGGRGDAGIRQLRQRSQAVCILGSMDIHIDVGLGCQFEGIVHLETVTTSHTESCQQLIQVSRAVR